MTTECTTGLQNGHMRTFLPFFNWNVRNKEQVSSKTVTPKHGLFASKQSQDGTQFHPDSAWKRSSKTCMKLTSAECTVENS